MIRLLDASIETEKNNELSNDRLIIASPKTFNRVGQREPTSKARAENELPDSVTCGPTMRRQAHMLSHCRRLATAQFRGCRPVNDGRETTR